ncbi:protein kinase [Streptomyces sp. NPDC059761]|uniref:protein kinase domain-containing protein n=1 Tax=Streptomyces sp. NPDC059761 TaxID=3346937 RepID=UPI003668D20B
MEAGHELAGRYRLQQRLGHGGMGEVWRALDLTLDRPVAVKTLLANRGDDRWHQALARFRREAKAVARLNHPRVAAIHDLAEHHDPPFLVLELLAGPDLAAHLRAHPGGLSIDTVLEYGAQTAEGLAAAHAAGVIHRDIKPHNLMLDGSGTVKVCDFGIARLDDATAGLTLDGQLPGTRAYMAPEQLSGKPVTRAADVYALGATLFHLLTGRLLFPDGLYAAVFQDPPPPSSLRSAIPKALDAYLLTLLAKDPSARPPTHTIPARLRALAHQIRPELLLDDTMRVRTTARNDIPGGPMSRMPLHFIWLLDCSHSMSLNGKITAVNYAVRETIATMRWHANDNPGKALMVRALTFNSGARWHIEEPWDIHQMAWRDVDAYGDRDMGAAFRLAARALHIPPMPQWAWQVVLALVSDGQPTDDWRSGLRELDASPWGRHAARVAVAVGADADRSVLKEFLADDELQPLDTFAPEQLARSIRWEKSARKRAQPDHDARISNPLPSPPSADDGEDVW